MQTPSESLAASALAEIRAVMGRRNINRGGLAELAGVPYHWVTDRFSGRTQLTLTDIERIATALNVPPAELLGAPAVSRG